METNTLIQQLYIAYYGRPADPNGLDYWVDRLESNGGDLNSVISAFATSSEFESRFGELSQAELINNLYQQLFGRSADDAGLAFYTDMLARGDSSLIELALDIANGAREDDSIVIGKRTEVAQQFTQELAERGLAYGDIDAAAQLLTQVTATTNVTEYVQTNVQALIDSLAGEGETPTTPPTTPEVVVLGVMQAIELHLDDALPARYTILDSAENLGGALSAIQDDLLITLQDSSNIGTLGIGFTVEDLQTVIDGAISISLNDETVEFSALSQLLEITAAVMAYGEDVSNADQLSAVLAKYDLSGTTIIGSLEEMVAASDDFEVSFQTFIELINADGYRLSETTFTTESVSASIAGLADAQVEAADSLFDELVQGLVEGANNAEDVSIEVPYAISDTLQHILAENANGSAVLAGAITLSLSDVSNGLLITLDVSENAAGTTLDFGGEDWLLNLTQAQLVTIEGSDVTDIVDNDRIFVTDVTTTDDGFTFPDAIALLDADDTIVLNTGAELVFTVTAFEAFEPTLEMISGGAGTLYVGDIGAGAVLAATNLVDTFDVSALGGGQTATIDGLQTDDKISVGGFDTVMQEWSIASGTLSYNIIVDVVTSVQVELSLTGINHLQYANGVFTVDNNIG